jgi:hypothetical protein
MSTVPRVTLQPEALYRVISGYSKGSPSRNHKDDRVVIRMPQPSPVTFQHVLCQMKVERKQWESNSLVIFQAIRLHASVARQKWRTTANASKPVLFSTFLPPGMITQALTYAYFFVAPMR